MKAVIQSILCFGFIALLVSCAQSPYQNYIIESPRTGCLDNAKVIADLFLSKFPELKIDEGPSGDYAIGNYVRLYGYVDNLPASFVCRSGSILVPTYGNDMSGYLRLIDSLSVVLKEFGCETQVSGPIREWGVFL